LFKWINEKDALQTGSKIFEAVPPPLIQVLFGHRVNPDETPYHRVINVGKVLNRLGSKTMN
jgi:hypothetical protein